MKTTEAVGAADETATLPAGARVRCEYREGHQGTLLALDDPRAWQGSLAFPGVTLPHRDAVTLHVRSCQQRGLLRDGSRPVLWDFPRPGALPRQIIYWDRKLSRVKRPTFSRGLTPREVIDCHAREHCGDSEFPMCIRQRDEQRALAKAGYPCDGGGNLRVTADELGALLHELQQLDDDGDDTAGDLRASIVDLIGIQQV